MPAFISLTCATAMCFFCLSGELAYAHQSGAVSGVDMYGVITPLREKIVVDFDQHFGELASASMGLRIDTNSDGNISEQELHCYMVHNTHLHMQFLRLQVLVGDREHLQALRIADNDIVKHTRAYHVRETSGKNTLRLSWRFEADWPQDQAVASNGATVVLHLLHRYRLFCSQLVCGPPGPGVAILKTDIPTSSAVPRPGDYVATVTNTASIPKVLKASLLCSFAPTNGTQACPEPGVPAVESGGPGPKAQGVTNTEDRFKATITGLLGEAGKGFSSWLAVLLCFAWGAMHAMTPGHGKVIVSAYLVSSRGTHRQAMLLGGLVALTHTAVVFVFALAAFMLQDRFEYPAWLQPFGALVIMLVGVNQVRIGINRLLGHAPHAHSHHHLEAHEHAHEHAPHDPSHEHSHSQSGDHERDHDVEHTHWGFFSHKHGRTHPHDRDVSGGSLAAIGVGGGMIPCPAAIIMLLLSWQVGAPGLGLACLVAFSLGLAGTLSLLGMLVVSGAALGGQWLSRRSVSGGGLSRFVRALPVLGGILLVIFGFLMLRK